MKLKSFTWKRSVVHASISFFMLTMSAAGFAQTGVLNLYSARHYQTDEALYDNFTRATGIKINRIEAGDEPLLERLRSEGANSPADVLLLVDAARLWKAQIEGLFQLFVSRVLESRIPAHLRAAVDGEQGSPWYAVSTRARVIVYNKKLIEPSLVQNYEDLSRPELKGKVCTRSAAHPYMLSLIGAMIEHLGAHKAESWARGVVANLARTPRGGDTDQIKAVATGECAVALTNTYYAARLIRSDKSTERETMNSVGVVFPNQSSYGTHMNVSGGGVVRHARNKQAAIRFMEYLASDEAQGFLANGNNEWPVVATAARNNPALNAWGEFKTDKLPISSIGRSQIAASQLIDRVGWR